ncbi:hypothetical protein TNCV_458741 [Trichonephila clavipes]|nr:hypothetical protein TNCV_458741 [Trichonephila clavipes]
MMTSLNSVQEESDPVDDETDEDEDNNNNESTLLYWTRNSPDPIISKAWGIKLILLFDSGTHEIKKELIDDIIVSLNQVKAKEELKLIFRSMKHRCEAVIKNKGNLNKL